MCLQVDAQLESNLFIRQSNSTSHYINALWDFHLNHISCRLGYMRIMWFSLSFATAAKGSSIKGLGWEGLICCGSNLYPTYLLGWSNQIGLPVWVGLMRLAMLCHLLTQLFTHPCLSPPLMVRSCNPLTCTCTHFKLKWKGHDC